MRPWWGRSPAARHAQVAGRGPGESLTDCATDDYISIRESVELGSRVYHLLLLINCRQFALHRRTGWLASVILVR